MCPCSCECVSLFVQVCKVRGWWKEVERNISLRYDLRESRIFLYDSLLWVGDTQGRAGQGSLTGPGAQRFGTGQ